MDFKTVLNNRVSVRHFNNQKTISKDDLVDIVKDAQRAPSWVNSQPWKVYIATGETLKAIKAVYAEKGQSGIKGNPDFPVVLNELWPAYTAKNMAEGNDETYGLDGFNEAQWQLFDAPYVAILTIPKGAPDWATHDLGMFTQTLMLSAQNKGISSIPAYAFIKYPDELRRIVGIPDDELVAIGVGLGYADTEHHLNKGNSVRNPVDTILTIKD